MCCVRIIVPAALLLPLYRLQDSLFTRLLVTVSATARRYYFKSRELVDGAPHPQIDSSYQHLHIFHRPKLSSTPHTSAPYNNTDSANNSNSFTKVAFTSLTVALCLLSQSLSIRIIYIAGKGACIVARGCTVQTYRCCYLDCYQKASGPCSVRRVIFSITHGVIMWHHLQWYKYNRGQPTTSKLALAPSPL